jgi:mono/diheme cytochrome c family protein
MTHARRGRDPLPPRWKSLGSQYERNGMKSISIWQTLSLAESAASPEEDPIARGRRVYLRFGCGTCHGIDAGGGVSNPNAQTNPIPALTRVKEGFNRQELLDVIFKGREPARKDPSGPPPPFRMNAWKSVMDESEGEALAAYLFSLMKEEDGSEW